MTHQLMLELPEAVFEALRVEADRQHKPPADVAVAVIAHEFRGVGVPPQADTGTGDTSRQAAKERLRRHFGAINLGYPIGSDNEQIDADLGRAYAENHEGA